MLSRRTMDDIFRVTKDFWDKRITAADFADMASGKEIGHRIADFVDEETTVLLEQHFECAHEHGKKGKRSRSMGDVWLKDAGIFHPINVKSGEMGKNGQPNMVSLGKLLNALLAREIDAYYLLIIKGTFVEDDFKAEVFLVDLLDYLDFATFDSGPGQIMLKEAAFYMAMKDPNYAPPNRNLKEKVEVLLEMLKDADRRLIVNRERRQEKVARAVEQFESGQYRPVNQAKMSLEES